MKIAYFILAHNKTDQLIRLIDRLNDPDNCFIIHFDKNGSDTDFKKLLGYYKTYKNVCFTKRIRCFWGDFSLVKATLECIKTITRLNINYDYAVLLSGHDYPLVHKETIKRFFELNYGKQFIQFFRPKDIWKSEDRIIYYHFNKYNIRESSIKNSIISKFQLLLKKLNIKRKLPLFADFYGGGQWWCLSRECIEYILEFTFNNKKVVSFFKFVHIPDELFFQTIILNSQFKNQVVNNNLRYIDWSTIPAPKILGQEDLVAMTSSNKLFGRKFDSDKDNKILDLIDGYLEQALDGRKE